MGFKQDWMERQIENLGKTLVGFILGKKGLEGLSEKYEESFSQGTIDEDILERQLKKLVEDGEICKAEDLLFASLEENSTPQKIVVGLNFYATLDKLDKNFLKEHNFTEEEISDGIKEIKKLI